MPENTMPIALLSQAGDSGRHLRDALAASGTPIVYECQAAEFDREALEQSGARVVVVNLDPEVEAHLDDVYALLDDDRYNVIFNEAQVSSQLSGWEQARWARHLAAKILGSSDADPPRPEGAEPVPQRSPVAVVAEAAQVPHAADIPRATELAESTIDAIASVDADTAHGAAMELDSVIEIDEFADISALLRESEADPLTAPVEEIPRSAAAPSLDDTIPMPVLDLSEFEDSAETADSAATATMEPDEFDGIFLAEDLPEASAAEATVEMSAFDVIAAQGEESLGFGDLDGFADADEESIEAIEMVSVDESETSPVEVDLIEIASASDAAAAGNDLAGLEMLDLDWNETSPAAPAGASDTHAEVEEIPAPKVESAFTWSLADLDDGAAAPDAGQRDEGVPATFGIEKISASEYLAPTDEVVEDRDDAVGLSLELIPIEEAVAHQTSGTGTLAHESWLDPSNQVAISRVWVLGASIGGPEAVREFLAEIPAKCPALFLLAQHMGAEFMEIMAQQLARSTSLMVRTPSHGERVSHGDIVIVPTTHRLRVDRAGVITLEAQAAGERPNSPSIDQVLEDVADRFGAKAGAIIFSGMAEDAAQGSRYLAGIGGTVYAQDPDTCVISSMVDGVVETGVVSFVGSPKALAGKLLGELNVTAKS
ncbi:MAG: chemotaxis protein CheB [Dokdonella sp.]|uniref:chemotaxis protein CheB n=2 Tax=Dokdonella sp. TaxID=2291710 RepID=UPI003BAEAB22